MVDMSMSTVARDADIDWTGLLTWVLGFCAVLASSVAQADGDACWWTEAALVRLKICI